MQVCGALFRPPAPASGEATPLSPPTRPQPRTDIRRRTLQLAKGALVKLMLLQQLLLLNGASGLHGDYKVGLRAERGASSQAAPSESGAAACVPGGRRRRALTPLCELCRARYQSMQAFAGRVADNLDQRVSHTLNAMRLEAVVDRLFVPNSALSNFAIRPEIE